MRETLEGNTQYHHSVELSALYRPTPAHDQPKLTSSHACNLDKFLRMRLSGSPKTHTSRQTEGQPTSSILRSSHFCPNFWTSNRTSCCCCCLRSKAA